MQIVVASPGEWVRVKVGANSFPVAIQIGNETSPTAAFLENARSATGGTEEIAMRRCPQLPPGTYNMTVTTRNGSLPAKLRVRRP